MPDLVHQATVSVGLAGCLDGIQALANSGITRRVVFHRQAHAIEARGRRLEDLRLHHEYSPGSLAVQPLRIGIRLHHGRRVAVGRHPIQEYLDAGGRESFTCKQVAVHDVFGQSIVGSVG